jgi:hypothetical protein
MKDVRDSTLNGRGEKGVRSEHDRRQTKRRVVRRDTWLLCCHEHFIVLCSARPAPGEDGAYETSLTSEAYCHCYGYAFVLHRSLRERIAWSRADALYTGMLSVAGSFYVSPTPLYHPSVLAGARIWQFPAAPFISSSGITVGATMMLPCRPSALHVSLGGIMRSKRPACARYH